MKTRHHLPLFTLAILTLILSSGAAFAQAVPGSAESSRVRGQIAPMESHALPTIENRVKSGGPAVSAPPGSDKVKFTLKSVKVEGMTAYDTASVARLYKGMIGTTVSLADIYGLAATMYFCLTGQPPLGRCSPPATTSATWPSATSTACAACSPPVPS